RAQGAVHRRRARAPACAPRAEAQRGLPGVEGSQGRHEYRRPPDRHRPPPGSLRFQPRRLRRVSYRALVRRRRHFLFALEFHHETQGRTRAGGHGQHVADRRRPDCRRGARLPHVGYHRAGFSRTLMFRNSYLRYEELTHIVQGWASAHPDLVRVASIGKSPEGRDLWLLEIGADPDRLRAAAWVDGNMHATEVCGSSVALAIAEDVIGLHRGADQLDLPMHVKERLKACCSMSCRACRPMAPRRCCAPGPGCARIRATGALIRRWRAGYRATSTATGACFPCASRILRASTWKTPISRA